MLEFICRIFLTAFLLFYSALSMALLGRIFLGSLHKRLKKARLAKAKEFLGDLTLAPHARGN